MNTEQPVLRQITCISELEVGMRIRIGNGCKKPPKSHSKKLADWEFRNREGWVDSVNVKNDMFGITSLKPGARSAIQTVYHNKVSDLTSIEVLVEAN